MCERYDSPFVQRVQGQEVSALYEAVVPAPYEVGLRPSEYDGLCEPFECTRHRDGLLVRDPVLVRLLLQLLLDSLIAGGHRLEG